MTTEELKQLADLSDQVIKLKELIKEMELRVVSFEYNRDLNKVLDPQYHYWDGKRSEASFITEKLLNIFGENDADESQPTCLGAVISRFSSQIFIEMKYPKNKMTAFIQLSNNNCPQVNLHKGSVWNYWFIEPSEKPIKLSKGKIPELLKTADLGDLGCF